MVYREMLEVGYLMDLDWRCEGEIDIGIGDRFEMCKDV